MNYKKYRILIDPFNPDGDKRTKIETSLRNNVQISHSDYTISIVYYQTNFNSISHFQMK